MRPLLIGQAPGPNTKPEFPLYPYPRGSAGARLARFAEIPRAQYLREFERINLIRSFPGACTSRRGDNFPIRKAKEAADELRESLSGRKVVMVGRGVATAFGYDKVPFFEWCAADGFEFYIVPHTSGLSRSYNSQESREQLRDVMRAARSLSDGDSAT